MGCSGCSMNTQGERPEMLGTYNWLNDLPDTTHLSNIVEVRFKGTRKEFFKNEDALSLKVGDLVVVATNPGHDVGTVSLTGTLADKQFKRKIRKPERYQWNKIYRKATTTDKEKAEAARNREYAVMVRSRQLANELELDMKIGDVEFRGDNAKAIFYYIAEGRVDFRELIRRYAREFRVKVEMKQIGARQEAGRIGGIGSCGRELCCSTWRTDFDSVTSDAAHQQGLSPNAEKMAGKCGKLKCCLMYELDTYLEAQDDFPNELLALETSKGLARHFKTEILNKKIWYTLEEAYGNKPLVLDLDDVKKIIQLNKRGRKPPIEQYLSPETKLENEMSVGSVNTDLLEKPKKKKNRKRKFSKRPNTNRQKKVDTNS
ncbi:regulatory iron-sulfur-containing complex subunit RicT [uncultured Sunxiuqinia sp.]|uniref:PSP1 domain-containing protein n=1 Tax=uncultured Sunxiuqinia sp. TaxID=1573825 RepID=UPI0026064C1B|nr:regulatory iron-sulfur-containing complex subunit RicT [uncultured Sunxiuqinia sp.]